MHSGHLTDLTIKPWNEHGNPGLGYRLGLSLYGDYWGFRFGVHWHRASLSGFPCLLSGSMPIQRSHQHHWHHGSWKEFNCYVMARPLSPAFHRPAVVCEDTDPKPADSHQILNIVWVSSRFLIRDFSAAYGFKWWYGNKWSCVNRISLAHNKWGARLQVWGFACPHLSRLQRVTICGRRPWCVSMTQPCCALKIGWAPSPRWLPTGCCWFHGGKDSTDKCWFNDNATGRPVCDERHLLDLIGN